MTYTIKQLAELAGVTPRTLRYYDEIGLLSPAQTGANGYRLYNQGSLLQLQQILFFRELDMPLKDIQQILSRPDFDLLQALETHRLALRKRSQRLSQLIDTLDQTIATLKGEWIMNEKDYFAGFDHSQYEEEAQKRWGQTQAYQQSQARYKSYSKEQKAALIAQSAEITLRMVPVDASIQPDDPTVQQAIADYHAYINKNFYDCDVAFLRNLADMWVEDPRFAKTYDSIRAGGAVFARQAVQIYCDQHA
jgi:DNA-binding transcriptional MerR regulator